MSTATGLPDRATACHTAPGTLARRDAATVLPGMVPFGAVLGVTIATTGSDRLAGLIGAPAIYGGRAQPGLVSLLGKGFSVSIRGLCAVGGHLRFLLYRRRL